jgi:hypothetical protein
MLDSLKLYNFYSLNESNLESISSIISLRELYLDKIRPLKGLDRLSSLRQLRKLHITSCSADISELRILSTFPSLKELSLQYCPINSSVIEAFITNATPLSVLRLEYIKLADDVVEAVISLVSLSYFYVANVTLSRKSCALLKQPHHFLVEGRQCFLQN